MIGARIKGEMASQGSRVLASGKEISEFRLPFTPHRLIFHIFCRQHVGPNNGKDCPTPLHGRGQVAHWQQLVASSRPSNAGTPQFTSRHDNITKRSRTSHNIERDHATQSTTSRHLGSLVCPGPLFIFFLFFPFVSSPFFLFFSLKLLDFRLVAFLASR